LRWTLYYDCAACSCFYISPVDGGAFIFFSYRLGLSTVAATAGRADQFQVAVVELRRNRRDGSRTVRDPSVGSVAVEDGSDHDDGRSFCGAGCGDVPVPVLLLPWPALLLVVVNDDSVVLVMLVADVRFLGPLPRRPGVWERFDDEPVATGSSMDNADGSSLSLLLWNRRDDERWQDRCEAAGRAEVVRPIVVAAGSSTGNADGSSLSLLLLKRTDDERWQDRRAEVVRLTDERECLDAIAVSVVAAAVSFGADL
jgi:hypothetical protein